MKKKKIGVYICHCGGNISDYVDVEKVKNSVKDEEIVFLATTTMFACADSAQKEIENDIRDNNLDGLVVASCSPKLHLITFRAVADRAGLNPYNYVHANIREQCSWAHSDDKTGATEKAIQLVKGAIKRVYESEALEQITIPAEKVMAVIGAGIGGMRTALDLSSNDIEVYLIEREFFVGGRVAQLGELYNTEETGKELVTRLYNEVKKRKNITLFTGAEAIEKSGSIGNFEIKVRINPRYIKETCSTESLEKAIEVCPVEVLDEFNYGLNKRKAIYKNYDSEYPQLPTIDMDNCTKCGECEKVCSEIDFSMKEEILPLKVGGIILNTGFNSYEPKKGEFGYDEIENVITLPQFSRLIELQKDNKNFVYNKKKIKNIAYIYCVGSRQANIPDGNKYCSRYCCTSNIHKAILAKKYFPEINNFHFTRGIRTYGKQEVFYDESSKQGDIYLQSYIDHLPEVKQNGNRITVKIIDYLTSNKEMEVDTDLVVLVTGMVPRENKDLVNVFKVPLGRDGFFNEIHMKLRPVETVIDGVYIAGASQAPKNIMETMSSSSSAAAAASAVLSKGELSLEPTLAVVDPDACNWCDKCTEACPFNAFTKVEHQGKQVALVIEANCKGCGMCLPVCPTNAIDLIGYTDNEVESLIDGLMQQDK
ncbi:MAG: CoB--CoM heterodisulfide reductase iron-sulfur subunit A family protein [Bacteroidota bacterium]|nr:CoB--CoM heterodisulfide reductase iron-sulfur subunit A family protein [Bacteroidota bacterium]